MVFFLPLLMAMLHITMGISNDTKNAPALWNDKYEAVYWMYGGNSIDLCCCVWVVYLITARSYYHIVERK